MRFTKILLMLMVVATSTVSWAEEATLPHDGFAALIWYNQAGHPRVNGSAAYFVQLPNVPAGTYLYNSFDFISQGKGRIVGVPTAGIMQNIASFGEYVHLFALAEGGLSYAPAANPAQGTNMSAAFAGGGGISYELGKGYKAVVAFKAIQTQGFNTLVGGVGVAWGHGGTTQSLKPGKH